MVKNKTLKPTITKSITSGLIGAILAILIFYLGYFTFLFFTPRSYWYTYHDIVVSQEYNSEEGLEFKSVFSRNRDVRWLWNDVLRCRHDDGYQYYSNSITQAKVNGPVDNPVTSNWRYQGDIPEEGVCYLEANISILLPFNLDKTQQIITEEFVIK